MLKTFKNLREIFDYNCPVCKSQLEHDIQFGSPDYECSYPALKENKYHLDFHAHDLKINVTVDIITSEITYNFSDDKFVPSETFLEGQLFLYLNSKCKNCSKYSFSSSDIDISLYNKSHSVIFLEKEWVFIDDDYFIEYQYYDSQYNKSFMKINKIIDKNNSTLVTLIKSKSFKLEPIHFDFSNLNSVKNKIKTIIAFR